jgi:hypothetical protein
MYLPKDELINVLQSGRSIEQWLNVNKDNVDYTIITWLRIDKERNGTFSVSYFEVFDEGDEGFLDIYEFSPYDPDEPFGVIESFLDYDKALNYCYKKYNGRPDRFVGAGLIQEEYQKYLKANRST